MQLFWICLAVLLAFAAALLGSGYYAFRMACARNFQKKARKKKAIPSHWAAHIDEIEAGAKWFLDRNPERVSIQSDDGLRLAGRYLACPDSRRTILLVHGYRSQYGIPDFGCVLPYYYSLGFNILLIDQRAHGDSEGKYITFGIRERYDVLRWTEFLERTKHPVDIFLDGLSMGAGTVMMAADLPMPECVRGIIADCGFTSAWEEFAHCLKRAFHFVPRLLMHTANFYAKRLAGIDFRSVSTIDTLSRTRLPVLFVHGEEDTFVPPVMSKRNYEACASEKTLILVPGAAHGMSYLVDRVRLQHVLVAFLKKHSRSWTT